MLYPARAERLVNIDWPSLNWTLIGATILGLSRLGSDGNKAYLNPYNCLPKKIKGALTLFNKSWPDLPGLTRHSYWVWDLNLILWSQKTFSPMRLYQLSCLKEPGLTLLLSIWSALPPPWKGIPKEQIICCSKGQAWVSISTCPGPALSLIVPLMFFYKDGFGIK